MQESSPMSSFSIPNIRDKLQNNRLINIDPQCDLDTGIADDTLLSLQKDDLQDSMKQKMQFCPPDYELERYQNKMLFSAMFIINVTMCKTIETELNSNILMIEVESKHLI
ncbi:hypothetical protein MAR_033914 [Mya arenaria]|uniref:Uncharacterized protein n=1 Tax=Mya arenaria TaxID=6604 RepID=A0ABY7GAC1_MYAAR|nr:hypothetical protein MAR_033914 [Mya arenaria]